MRQRRATVTAAETADLHTEGVETLSLRDAGDLGDRLRAGVPLDTRTAVAIAAVAMVALYLVTRLWFIGRFPYFYDEALYASWADEGEHSLHALFLSETIGREPLLAWLGIPLIKLGFSPLTAVRLVSVTSGLATVGVVGLLGRKLDGLATGVVAAALCVVLPFFVVHDAIGIYEPLVTLIMASALYVQLELARRPDLRTGVLLGVILCAALLAKQNTEPAVGLIPLSLLCFDWSPTGRGRRLGVWLGAAVIGVLGAAGADLLLRSSAYYPQYIAIRKTSWYTVRSLHAVLADPFGSSTAAAWAVLRATMVGYVTVPLLGALLVGVVWAARRRLKLTLVLLAWILVPVIGALLFTLFPFPRHFMYAMPPAIALMAYAIVQLIRWTRRVLQPRVAAAACTLAAALLLLPTLLFDGGVLAHPDTFHYPSLDDWQYVTGIPAGGQWPAIADAIKRRSVGSRVVILTPNANSRVVRYLLDDNPRYVFALGSSQLAPSAQFVYTEAEPGIFDLRGLKIVQQQHFVLIGRYARPRPCTSLRPPHYPSCPRGGDAVLLYERPQR